MASSINASITSTGIVQTADATGILQLQTDGTTGLTLNANANVTVSNSLFVSGSSVQPLVLGTVQNAPSGTSIDFTGIPSWVKRITINVTGLSFAAAGTARVRIGSGSIVSTGYTWIQATVNNAANPAVTTDALGLANFTTNTGAGAAIVYGQCVLTLVDTATNLWVSTGTAGRPSDSIIQTWTGYIALSGVLDRVSLVATTSTFDAGSVNILYE